MKKDTRTANVRSPTPVSSSPVNTPEELAALLKNVATNPAKVEFPRDTWGFTSDLKKHALRAASSIQGQPDKQLLFLSVLEVLRTHAEARFEVDLNFKKDLRDQALKAYAERTSRQRAFGNVPEDVNPVEQEANING
jgi:hypothetical protein